MASAGVVLEGNGKGITVATLEGRDDSSTTLAQQIIAEEARHYSEQANFRLRWDDCARYIQPRKGNIVTKNTPGMPQTQNIYDTTAEKALLVFGAGVLSSMTPTGERWFVLQPRNKKTASPAVRTWFDDVTEAMMEMIGQSTWYLSGHESYLDDGCFGTSVLMVDELKDEEDEGAPFNVVNVSVGTFTYAENSKGDVDRLWRKWKWSARQIVEEFGEENCGDNVRKAFRSQNAADAERQFTLICKVYPRRKEQIMRGATVKEKRPWGLTYVCVEDMKVILEEGTYEKPFMATRTLASNIETYGRGPGIQTMPDIKMVNKMKQDRLVVAERISRPGWIQADDAAYKPDNRPDGISYFDASRPETKPEQIKYTNDLQWLENIIKEQQQEIREAFFNPMFLMFQNMDKEDAHDMTASEAELRNGEKLVLFSPIFAAMVKGKLNPFLHRVFGIGLRKNKFPPLPADWHTSGGYEVEYTSKIALAIKAIEMQALAAAAQMQQTMMPLDPRCAFLLKACDALRRTFRNIGVPSSLVRTDEEIDEMMKQHQEAQQQLQAAQAAQLGTQAVKNLGPDAQAAATGAIKSKIAA